MARFWTPPEAAVMGESLWIAVATLAVGAVLLWLMSSQPGRWTWFDGGFTLLTCGQLAGGIHVVMVGGDKRAAANLLVEYLSIATFVLLLLRHLRQDRPQPSVSPRSTGELDLISLLPLIVASLITLSVLGVYQHHFGLPSIARRYVEPLRELDQLEATPASQAASSERIAQLKQKLEQDGIPTDANARKAFYQRLTSSEPFGFCALANTFAAILLVLLILSFAAWPLLNGRGVLWSIPDFSRPATGVMLATWLLGFWALLLTKSRTAVLALLLTGGVILVVQLASQWFSRRKAALPVEEISPTSQAAPKRAGKLAFWSLFGGGIALLSLLAAAVTWAGGLDVEVLTEAPKSLRYRLEYWLGTVQMMQDHPWFGVGPGNFRSVYLWYKLPGSSEEIADPHNMVLEAWTSGGLLSLAGLLLMAGAGVRSIWSPMDRRDSPLEAVSATAPRVEKESFAESNVSDRLICERNWLFGIGAASLVIAWWGRYLLDGVFDDWLILYVISWMATYAAIAWLLAPGEAAPAAKPLPEPTSSDKSTAESSATRQISRWAVQGAALALGINLLAAGGFGMPAIFGLWLLLTAAATSVTSISRAENRPALFPGSQWLVPASVTLAFFAALVAAWPVWTAADERMRLMNQGVGSRSSAWTSLANIAEIDPWSPSLAEAAGLTILSEAESPADWKRGEAWLVEASRRDTRSYRPHELLAQALYRRAQQEKAGSAEQRDLAEQAVAEYRLSNARYRSSSRLLSGWAETLSLAHQPEEASRIAEAAIEQDALNRKLGHSDRYLADDQLSRLQSLVLPDPQVLQKVNEDLRNMRSVP